MNKKLFLVFLLLQTILSYGQIEVYPLYKGCENVEKTQLEKCFLEKVSDDFYSNFSLSSDTPMEQKNFYVVFIATKNGDFEVIHVSSTNSKVNNEVERVFSILSNFEPATYNGHEIDKQFIIYYPDVMKAHEHISDSIVENSLSTNGENDANLANTSSLRIPFSFSKYNTIDSRFSKENIHTSVKPYIYQLVLDNEASLETNQKNYKSWWGRKLWNENMVEISGQDYWFHIDPIFNLQLGKDNSNISYTYNNTRALRIEGAVLKKLSFSSSIYESQGRFSEYFNRYSESIKPSGGNPAIIPGQGIAKAFGTNAYDYPVATGYLSYSPNKTFNIQLGRDKNFIGDGYRSLLLSDSGSSHTFFKIQSNFWKIQYTNLWLWLRDVRPEATMDGVYKRKFVAIHHLSWNATSKLNIGLFESVVWAKTSNQGFDVDYINPIILFRPIEFAIGSRGGNAMLGLNAKYNFQKDLSFYSQILFDEITLKEISGNKGYWGNKYAFQIGAKYYNSFAIPNLTIQAEYNMARPYTYSHNNPETNYGHFNQSLAHSWGSNFREGLFVASYERNRWFGMVKALGGIKGFDYNTSSDNYSYGGDIYRDYSERVSDYGIKTGQGNKANIFIGEIQGGYIVNPSTNLKLFGGLLLRKFDAPVEDLVFKNGNTTWFTFGLRSDISNWYFDF